MRRSTKRSTLFAAFSLLMLSGSSAISGELEVVLKQIRNYIDIDEERMECTLFFDVHNRTDARIDKLSLSLSARGSAALPLAVVEGPALEVEAVPPGGVLSDQVGPVFDGGYGFCEIDFIEVTDKHLVECETAQGRCQHTIKVSSEISDVDFRVGKDFGNSPSTFLFGSASTASAGAGASRDAPSPEEMFVLGLKHFRGEGVIQDYVYAHMWFNIAASRGLNVAKTERDKVAAEMTDAELAEARKLARQCVNLGYQGC